MSTCPVGSTTGFINITGPLGPTTVNKIAVNGAPLTINFGPRSTPATLVGNLIDESPTNTVLYKGTQYALQSAQLCAPSHTGYSPPTKSPVAEVVLLFVNQQVVSSYPSMIMLVVPLYTGNVDERGAYLQQLMNGDATEGTFATLQSLFYSTPTDRSAQSYSYKTCIGLVSSAINTCVFYFPNGVTLTQQETVMLVTQASGGAQGTLPAFQIPPAIRGSLATVLTFEVGADGTATPTSVSEDGLVSSAGLSSASDEFTNMVQLFTMPPSISNTASGTSCPPSSTLQYKCLPFSKINSNTDFSGANTLPQELALQNATRTSATTTSATSLSIGLFDDASPLSVIVDIIIVIAVILFIVFLGYFVYAWLVPDVDGGTPVGVATGPPGI